MSFTLPTSMLDRKVVSTPLIVKNGVTPTSGDSPRALATGGFALNELVVFIALLKNGVIV